MNDRWRFPVWAAVMILVAGLGVLTGPVLSQRTESGVGLTPQRLQRFSPGLQTSGGVPGREIAAGVLQGQHDPWGGDPTRRLSLCAGCPDTVLHAKRYYRGITAPSGLPLQNLKPSCGHTPCIDQLRRLCLERPEVLGVPAPEAATLTCWPNEREKEDVLRTGAGPGIQRAYNAAFDVAPNPGFDPLHPSETSHRPLSGCAYQRSIFGTYSHWTGWVACFPGMGPRYCPGYPPVFGPEPDCTDPSDPPTPQEPPGSPQDPDPVPTPLPPPDDEPMPPPLPPDQENCCDLWAQWEAERDEITERIALVEDATSDAMAIHVQQNQELAALREARKRAESRLSEIESYLAWLRTRVGGPGNSLPAPDPGPDPSPPDTPLPPTDPPGTQTHEVDVVIGRVDRGRRGNAGLKIPLGPGVTRVEFDLAVTPGAELCVRQPIVWVGPTLGAAGGTAVDRGFCGLIVNGKSAGQGRSLLHTGSTGQERFIVAGNRPVWATGTPVRVQLTCDLVLGASLVAGGEHLVASSAPPLWPQAIGYAQVGLDIDWDHKPEICPSCEGWCWGRLGGTNAEPWRILGTITTRTGE